MLYPAELFLLKLLGNNQIEFHAREKVWVGGTILCASPCSSSPNLLCLSVTSRSWLLTFQTNTDSTRDWRLCGPLVGSELVEVWEAMIENQKEGCTEQGETKTPLDYAVS